VTGARGPRIPLVIGQALIVVGCLGLLPIVQRSSYGAMWAQLLLIGAGCGLSVPAMTSALLGTVKKEQSGIASGVLNSSRQTGSVIGVSLFGSLIAARSGFVPGFHAALWISAALTMCGCLLALRTQPAKG
jgi:DHA2 family methylenomycin A resistance protein-like MFS transporter